MCRVKVKVKIRQPDAARNTAGTAKAVSRQKEQGHLANGID